MLKILSLQCLDDLRVLYCILYMDSVHKFHKKKILGLLKIHLMNSQLSLDNLDENP